MLRKLQGWFGRRQPRPAGDGEPPLSVTPAAAAEVRRRRAELGWPRAGLRLRARAGCGRVHYEVRLAPAPAEGEHVFAVGGVTVFLDPESAAAVAGATLDFVRSLRASGFRLEHPHPPAACGCRR